ncbi:FAS-associated death domain protein [Mixophyes fleayi]|uniref:FAS-associated death domain protein n=1 Tax=Mixophyes fleayi TaxID=3061075 RepID=UPI003F4DBAF1
MDNFSVILLRISGQLSEKEINDLKFLCREKIAKKKLETISSATDLFTKLQEQTDITQDDLGFLVQLLQSIERRDLVEELRKYQPACAREETAGDWAQDRDQLDRAFDIICDNVGRDWRRLMRSLGMTDPIMEQVMDAHPRNMREQLMQCLIKWREKKRDDASVTALMHALECCKLRLVAEKVTDGLNLSHGTA